MHQQHVERHARLMKLKAEFDAAKAGFNEVHAAFDRLEDAHLAHRPDDAEVEMLQARLAAFQRTLERFKQLSDEFWNRGN